MVASQLLAALAKKHSDAVFVPECKNGPTQTGSHRRLDAWVLLKTWSPVTTVGYEIKVSLSDWRRDQKIADYMGLCHLLYIVAPKGIVPVDELPEGVGLMEAVGDAARLVTRRKAARREIEMPVSLMVYVLMCRAKVTDDHAESRDKAWRLTQLQEWAQSKDDRKKLHWALSSKIQRVFDEQEQEMQRVRRRISELEYIERRITEMGFDPTQRASQWQAEHRLKAMTKAIEPWLLKQIEQVEGSLGRVRLALTELTAPLAEVASVDE